MTERTASELAAAMRAAYRPDEPVQFTIQPGDHKAIAALELIARWLKQSENARADFRQWRERERG